MDHSNSSRAQESNSMDDRGPHDHPLTWSGPTPQFLDGALLGNGALGLVVTTRPDAVVLHLGHNDVWDLRIDESHADDVGTFGSILERIKSISEDVKSLDEDPWFAEYRERMARSYSRPYPRPYPCGSLILGFSRRETQLIGHELDISTGLCRISMIHNGEDLLVEVFVDQDDDLIWIRCVNAIGDSCGSPFTRVRLMPDPDGPAEDESSSSTLANVTFVLPAPGEPSLRDGVTVWSSEDQKSIGFREGLPRFHPGTFEITKSADEFSVYFQSNASLQSVTRRSWYGTEEEPLPLERALQPASEFFAVLSLVHGTASLADADHRPMASLAQGVWHNAWSRSEERWTAYWEKSKIALSDKTLEGVWYRNTYFTNCCLRAGTRSPGLFGNWSYRNIGTAWHGDYHMNYNAQQLFWGVFSSNRVESHLPYVDLVETITPLSRQWAKEYYELEGAYFPHSAYQVPMSTMPYPSPIWGWEVCETPWTVQSLWWHYEFTKDIVFLRERAFAPIRDAVLFLSGYISRDDCRGEAWGDDRWHIYPTVAPELYGLTPGLRMNQDCLVDITLTRFIFKAYFAACEVLGKRDAESKTIALARDVLEHLPDYPTAETPEGTVFVSVPNEHPDTVYNVPIPAMTVFPGEDHSWESDDATVDMAVRSCRRQLLEGGNELVFANLQAARLGILDLEAFKRQIAYCELPNGTCTDMVLQVHGRYNDATPFEFMAPKGVWIENFALTAVINECLMQSYSGTIRVFPNCEELASAQFENLRAMGAFLVSAELNEGKTEWIRVESDVGSELTIQIPWRSGAICTSSGEVTTLPGGLCSLRTEPNQVLIFKPAP